MLVELVEAKIAQFVVADSVGKDVIDGRQDLMGHGHDCPLVPAPSFETVKLVSQVAALGFCCCGRPPLRLLSTGSETPELDAPQLFRVHLSFAF